MVRFGLGLVWARDLAAPRTGRYEITLINPNTSSSETVVWRGPQSFDLSRVVTRWSLPPDPYTDDELGSGISWALHPHFCDEILEHLK